MRPFYACLSGTIKGSFVTDFFQEFAYVREPYGKKVSFPGTDDARNAYQ